MRTDNTWLSVPRAARLLGRSNSAVHRAISRGDLPAQRIGRSHPRIAAGVVAELLAAGYRPAGSAAPLRLDPNSDAAPVRLVEPAGAA